LFEEKRRGSGERHDERDDEEHESHGAPECGVARGAGLLRDIGVGNSAGDKGEEQQRCSEDVEVRPMGLVLFTADPNGLFWIGMDRAVGGVDFGAGRLS